MHVATGLNNLKIYKLSEELELKVHNFTRDFPNDERFRSVDQLRRSSSAVTNNIAEAYKKQSLREQLHILQSIAVCEAEETMSNLLRCGKKSLCDLETANKMADEYLGLIKAIQGYIRFLKNSSSIDYSPKAPFKD